MNPRNFSKILYNFLISLPFSWIQFILYSLGICPLQFSWYNFSCFASELYYFINFSCFAPRTHSLHITALRSFLYKWLFHCIICSIVTNSDECSSAACFSHSLFIASVLYWFAFNTGFFWISYKWMYSSSTCYFQSIEEMQPLAAYLRESGERKTSTIIWLCPPPPPPSTSYGEY